MPLQDTDEVFAPITDALAHVPLGETVRFWWRDDDASASSPALDRLLALSSETCVPVGLAVIPGHLKPSLVDCLHGKNGIDVLVHGWLHKNHAPAEEPRSEYPRSRPVQEVREELPRSLAVLRDAFSTHTIPVFVPPWNRFPSEFEDQLAACGYRGLSSVLGNRPQPQGAQGLRRAHCDMNIVAAKDSVGRADIKGASLTAKRIRAGERGPFGVVTHHGLFDDRSWTLCERFWRSISSHDRAQAVSARSVFCAE
jgi:hypothetical protein